jgi:probable F420-dependent oxidoreductase
MEIGRVGIWSTAFRSLLGHPDGVPRAKEAATALEELGYGAVWLGGSPPVADAEPLLTATSRLVVATGILSIWEHPAAEVAAGWAALEGRFPGRFVLGLGVSHGNRTPAYARPYEAMAEYLTALDAAPVPVPPPARVLAALGPRMLRLARDRSAGAHPYLVTAGYVEEARATLGPDALLAPEVKVVLDDQRERALSTARAHLAPYLEMPNYTNNLRRLGFTDDDLRDGGSERLLEATFALGGDEAAARRVDEFLAAGADHVAVQVVTPGPRGVVPYAEWRRLAAALPVGR